MRRAAILIVLAISLAACATLIGVSRDVETDYDGSFDAADESDAPDVGDEPDI